MKKICTLPLLLMLFCCSCSKDILEEYDNRITGTWRITDINRVGFGGKASGLPFQGGSFTFFEQGSLDYTNEAGTLYQGHWDIERRFAGNHTHYQLHITVADTSGQQVLSETYDDVRFSGSARFKARIFSGLRTYVTHFRK